MKMSQNDHFTSETLILCFGFRFQLTCQSLETRRVARRSVTERSGESRLMESNISSQNRHLFFVGRFGELCITRIAAGISLDESTRHVPVGNPRKLLDEKYYSIMEKIILQL